MGRDVLVIDHARGSIGGPLARDGVVKGGAEGIDVCPWPLPAPVGGVLLVGAIPRLDERADGLGMGGDLASRRAEVNEHRRAVLADDDVIGGDVAVQEVAGVHGLERFQQWFEDAIKLGLARRSLQASEPSLETATLLEVK